MTIKKILYSNHNILDLCFKSIYDFIRDNSSPQLFPQKRLVGFRFQIIFTNIQVSSINGMIVAYSYRFYVGYLYRNLFVNINAIFFFAFLIQIIKLLYYNKKLGTQVITYLNNFSSTMFFVNFFGFATCFWDHCTKSNWFMFQCCCYTCC